MASYKATKEQFKMIRSGNKTKEDACVCHGAPVAILLVISIISVALMILYTRKKFSTRFIKATR